jgi:thymidylate synthase
MAVTAPAFLLSEENVIALLQKSPTSRRALIQIFNAEDNATRYKEVPCTTTLQFLLRDDRLHLIATMRSNDAYLGLPHDIFCFTMLQEFVARILKADLGSYRHYVGSMHLYDKDRNGTHRYLGEGATAFGCEEPWPRSLLGGSDTHAADPFCPGGRGAARPA